MGEAAEAYAGRTSAQPRAACQPEAIRAIAAFAAGWLDPAEASTTAVPAGSSAGIVAGFGEAPFQGAHQPGCGPSGSP